MTDVATTVAQPECCSAKAEKPTRNWFWLGYKVIPKVNMTKEEWFKWAIPELAAFQAKYPDDIPSVDRINADGPYEVGNVRIIKKGENIIRCRIFTSSLGVDADSSKYDKIKAICKIFVATCRNLKVAPQDVAASVAAICGNVK